MEWWKKYFSEDYLKLYKHDENETSREAEAIIRMLQIEPGKHVLDLACGFGRHAVVLAQKGLKVTGYDLSEGFLKKAKELSETVSVKLDLKQGDMRDIPYENKFDACINMFTAFGFFESEKDDLKVLKGVRKALKAGRAVSARCHQPRDCSSDRRSPVAGPAKTIPICSKRGFSILSAPVWR